MNQNSNNTNSESEVRFFEAVKTGDVGVVRQLAVAQPALLNAYDYSCFGATPITAVTFKDDREMIAALIELGADPNRRSDWEMGPWSPLHSAIHACHDDLAEYLLEHGAELDVHTAAALGRVDDLKRILKESPQRVHERGGDGCTPLHFAGSEAAIDVLLEHGAEPEARCTDHFSTPVQYLADPRPQMARYLFSKGATADIFSAALCGALETVRDLIAEDAGVLDLKIDQETFPPGPEQNVQNIMTYTIGGGCTPLHAAAVGNQPEMIKLLIELGADPNVRGGYDNATSLHQVAWRDNLEAAQALVECGADVNRLSGDIHNNSPAGWAIVAGSADVFCLLMDRGCEILGFFSDDTQAALDGEFRKYKVVPQENYQRIADCLAERLAKEG